MQFIDKPFTSNVTLMSPEHAYMAGRIKTSDLEDLRNFQRAFPFNPERVVEVFKELVTESKKYTGPPTDAQKVDIAFTKLLPRCYSPQSVGDWTGVIRFTVTDMAAYTITVDGTKASVEAGTGPTPTSSIEMDYETYRSVMRFEVLEDSHLVSDDVLLDWESQEEMADVELSDDQLEAVAGGKGEPPPPVQACAADACGAAACGADACAAAACGAAACGAAACAAAACPAAACGIDAGIGPDIGACAINVIPCVPFI